MKNLLILVTLFQISLAHAQWRTVYRDSDSANNIVSASFFSSNAGFVATDKWIGFTNDSGRSFEHRTAQFDNINSGSVQIDPLIEFSPRSIQAFNHDTALLTGTFSGSPSILYSVDNGHHWDLVYHRQDTSSALPSDNAVYKIDFPQQGNTGFAIQANEIIKTIDRGKSWQTSYQNAHMDLFAISFANARTGYAAGPHVLVKTTDGGSSWSSIEGIPYTIQAVSVINDQELAVLSSREDSYYLTISVNGGKSWQETHAFPKGSKPVALNDIHFTDDSNGYACGTAVYLTSNGGKDWQLMPGADTTDNAGGYLSMFFMDKEQAWVTGPSSLLMKKIQPGYLKLHSNSGSAICTDNKYHLTWTNRETGPLDIFYSTDKGNHFEKLVSSLPATTDSGYTFDIGQDAVPAGSVLFKIIDQQSVLSDTATFEFIQKSDPAIQLVANDGVTTNAGVYSFRALIKNGGESPELKWFVNDVAVPGADSINSLATLAANDQVQVRMTTSIACATKQSVSSNLFSIDGNATLKIFPNPASNVINLSALKQEDQWESVDVTDINGQQKISAQSILNKGSLSIPISDLSKGVYFVRLFSASRPVKSIKFVKL